MHVDMYKLIGTNEYLPPLFNLNVFEKKLVKSFNTEIQSQFVRSMLIVSY